MTEHWKEQPLEKLFSFVIGGDWGVDLSQEGDGLMDVYCIRGTEIKDWEKTKGSTAVRRKIEFSSLEKRKLQVGDILVEISGGGPDQPVGRTVIVDNDVLDFEPETPKICTNFLRLIRLVDSVDKVFVNYYLRHIYITGEVVNYQGGSNNLRNLKFKEYSRIQIPLAPLSEQRRIVKKLNTLFGHFYELKTRLGNINTLLQQFRHAVLTHQMTGELTKSWREVSLGELGEWNGGGTPSKALSKYWINGSVPWITPKDMKDAFLDDSQDKLSQEAMAVPTLKLVKPDSILIVMRSGILRRILPIAMNKVPTTINQDLKALTLKGLYNPKFILYSLIGLEDVIRRNCMKSGTTVESIEFPFLKKFMIRIPKSIKEQERVVTKVESLLAIADHIEVTYNTLQEKIDHLPQTILRKAFRGELLGLN